MNTKIDKAIEAIGGPGHGYKARAARILGVSEPYVSKMIRTGQVSANLCRQIEELSGRIVTAAELRPQIFGPVDSDTAA